MVPSPAPIRSTIVVSLQAPDGPLPLTAELRYDPADPYAVQLEIGTGEQESVTWFFARDLLRDGTTGTAGHGDVRVSAHSTRRGRDIAITLSTPEGEAHFRTDLAHVVEFLTSAYTLVPTGSELTGLDLDAELALLLR